MFDPLRLTSVIAAEIAASPTLLNALIALLRAIDVGRRLLAEAGYSETVPAGGSGYGPPAGLALPRWDSKNRRLHYLGKLVKVFTQSAENQVTVLSAFEEDHWARRIDNPIPPGPNADDRERLKDAVRRLNQSQVNRLLHFRQDGSGQGVLWEPISL
jgi:hypothetical protein